MSRLDTSSAEFLSSGTLINGRYLVERLIGSGGTGFVLLALDRHFDETKIVLKLLYPHLVQNERAYLRFRNETSIAFELATAPKG